ncbi:MAG: hypothetical protein ACJZ9F_11435 [Rhodospirillaceae bacterium]
MTATTKDFKKIYNMFSASISTKLDCGKICAPLNDGIPVCCSTENAIPIVEKEEWDLLKSRSDLWKLFVPFDKASKKIVKELPNTTCAVECKGAAFCERENRSLACRSFPFFPYFTKEGELIGLACYWAFEDRCWVISNMQVAEKKFVTEMIEAYEYLFDKDEEQYEAYYDESATMRRVYSRRNEPIQIIGRDMEYLMVLPKSKGRIIPTKASAFRPFGPFISNKAYHAAIKEAGGEPEGCCLP